MNPSDQSLKEAFRFRCRYFLQGIVMVTGTQHHGLTLWHAAKNCLTLDSTTSKKICALAGYDPYQIIGKGPLKPCKE